MFDIFIWRYFVIASLINVKHVEKIQSMKYMWELFYLKKNPYIYTAPYIKDLKDSCNFLDLDIEYKKFITGSLATPKSLPRRSLMYLRWCSALLI